MRGSNGSRSILTNSCCFEHYLVLGKPISRAVAEQRMQEKFARSLTEDIALLLPGGITFTEDDAIDAFGKVWMELVARIKCDPWKLSEQVNGLCNGKMSNLLR